MSDQDIDKLFNEGLSDASMPFDESAWAGAERAIIAHEAAKRRRRIIIWFFAGLMLISGGLGLYNYSSTNVAQIQNDTNPMQSKVGMQSPAENSNADDKVDSSDDRTDPKNNEPADERLAKADEPANENAAFKSDYENPAYGNAETSPVVFIPDEDDVRERKKETESARLNETVSANNTFGMSMLAIHPAQIIPFNEKSNPAGKERRAADWNLPDHWDTKINVIAGVLPLDYFEDSEDQISRLPYYAGLGITKIHNYSWEFGTALLYEELLYSPNEEIIEQVEYGFGRTVTRHNISRQRGAYITLPVYTKYRIRNNHALMFGLQYSHLLQSYSAYSIEEENQQSGIINISNETGVSGFNNDLSSGQASLIIGYDLTLSDRLRLQMMGRLGANSLYKNSIQDNPWEDRVHFRLGIEYSIWRF